MANTNAILSVEEEDKLRQPIDEYVGKIQAKIDELRKDGTDVVVNLNNHIQLVKEDKNYTKEEQRKLIEEDKKKLVPAKAVEEKNKAQIDSLIADAEKYLDEHFEKDYYSKVVASCAKEKEDAQAEYDRTLAELKAEHEKNLSGLTDKKEIKDENYVYKNRQFDAKMALEGKLQQAKDRQHEAFTHKYHLIDLLRMSKFTFAQNQAQKRENRKYTFNRKQFLLSNGLYIVIICIFVFLCIITPIVKHTQLFTTANILNILQQASPRMFLALGVAGLILLTGTDLSIGRMVGMSMVTATIVMHQGANTGAVFGHVFDTTGIPNPGTAPLHLPYDAFCINCGLLHGKIQDASVHFDHVEHADHLRSCYLCNQGRVLWCN